MDEEKNDKIFELNIDFYSNAFHLNNQEKETFINLSKKIINVISEPELLDLDNPLIEECIYKCAIFCIHSNNGIFTKLSKEENEKLIKTYAIVTRSDIQKNFKDLDRISTISSKLKDFINNLSITEKEITKRPLEVLNSYNATRNFKRKLDEVHNTFFDSTELSFLFKRLIWGVFICLVNLNELKSSTFDKTKLFFTICQDILIRIPNIFYPRNLGNEMVDIISKKNIIKEYFKKYMSDDIDNDEVLQNIKNFYTKINIFKSEISLKGEDLSDKKKLGEIINKLDDYYYQNILNKLYFDQRIILDEKEIFNNSPKIKKDINLKDSGNTMKNSQNYSLTCNRELFKEEKTSRKINFNLENNPLKTNKTNISNEKEATLIMTTYSRIWNLLNWAQGLLKNYEKKNEYISKLQEKYKPFYLNINEYSKFIPIKIYAKKYLDELIKLLIKYKVNSKFDIDLLHLYINYLFLLLENDTNIFSENFTALLLYNDEFIKASVALSFELDLTIFDITEIELNKIYEQLNLDVYDFWKIILASNINIYHIEMQKHLEEIDYQLTTFLLWRNPSEKFKNELKEFLENENIIKDEKEKNSIYKLILHESIKQSVFLFHNKKDFQIPFINENFKKNSINKLIFKDCYEYVENYNKVIGISVLLQRIIFYSINLNKFIFDNFFPENNDSKLSNPIFIEDYIKKESELIIKVILTNYDDISILWGLHIDQFILCSIILILEKYNLFNFSNTKNENNNDNNDISSLKINKNILHNSYNKSKLSVKQINEDLHIFNHVKISEKKFINIIEFYNEKFKIKFLKYYNDINNIKIKNKIDYFNIQNDLINLLNIKKTLNKNINTYTNNINNEENEDDKDDEFNYLEKSKKKFKISENKYILFSDNKNLELKNKKDDNIISNNLSLNENSVNIEESISLLKKLNIKNNNHLYFDLFKEEKYCAYRNDNLKQIYYNIIKSELPMNEENRKTNKEKLNKLKELIKSKGH